MPKIDGQLLVRWNSDAYIQALPTRLEVQPQMDTRALAMPGPVDLQSPALDAHMTLKSEGGAASVSAGGGTVYAAESDRMEAKLKGTYGPLIGLAPTLGSPRATVSVDTARLTTALSLTHLGIPDRIARARASENQGVFFAQGPGMPAAQDRQEKQTFNTEQERVMIADLMAQLGQSPLGDRVLNYLANPKASKKLFGIELPQNQKTLFYALDENTMQHVNLQVQPNSGLYGFANFISDPRTIGINKRLLHSMERQFVFGSLDPSDSVAIDQRAALYHEAEHISRAFQEPSTTITRFGFDDDHPSIHKLVERYLRFNGTNGLHDKFVDRIRQMYASSPAMEAWSRGVLYTQVSDLADQINAHPDSYDAVVLEHLRNQSGLGVNIERYVNWLLPELDKRVDPPQ